MPIKCDAIVENGLLRPLTDLGLPNAERVVVTVERAQAASTAQPSTKAFLLSRGLAQLSGAEASALAGCDLTDIALEEVNRRLPLKTRGKPLSVAVIEERRSGW